MIVDVQHLIASLADNGNPEKIRHLLLDYSRLVGRRQFCRLIAGEIVAKARFGAAIPEAYARYRDMVLAAIEFFLSRMQPQRLIGVVVDLADAGIDRPAGNLLTDTATHFPTLHKLGQVIARNRHIDPSLKKWLVRLENGNYGSSREHLLAGIRQNLPPGNDAGTVCFDDHILSEASVAAVIAYRQDPRGSAPIAGVCKLLRPEVADYLEEELYILEETASFLEKNRDRFQLKDLNVREIFATLKETMAQEADLATEQRHLATAAEFYRHQKKLIIPKVFPLSSPQATFMEYIEGRKITDTALSASKLHEVAATLFETVVCGPLFSRAPSAIFHGDPHAGNILVVADSKAETFKLVLLDWALAGTLTLEERIRMSQLLQAMIRKDGGEIASILLHMAQGLEDNKTLARKNLKEHVDHLLGSRAAEGRSIVNMVCWLLEELSYHGLVFSGDLMLLRKAVFTLEGVLADISPDFDVDRQLNKYISARLKEEMPQRLGNMFFPWADSAANYKSLISNSELQALIFHQSSALMLDNLQIFWQPFFRWFAPGKTTSTERSK